MSSTKTREGAGTFKFLSFALLMVFFIGMVLLDGPEWCVDSQSYTSMDFSREPVYPLFLLALRTLFERLSIDATAYGLPAYLTLAAVLQSLLWVVSTGVLGDYIYELASRSFSAKRAMTMSAIAQILQVAVACLNRFVAKRGSMYSESIMTESLAMPLFVIFTVVLAKSFDGYKTKDVLKLFFLSVIICSIRKQMLIVLLMWGFVSFVMHLFIKRYRSLKNFSITVICVVIAFVMINMLDASYNLAVRGVFAGHTGNSRGGLCTVLYTASPEDADLFADADPEKYPELSALYTRIMDECIKEQLTIDFCPGIDDNDKPNIFNSDWPTMVDHYALCYDVIGFDVVLPICDEYVAEHFPGLSEVEAQLKENQVEGELFDSLLRHHISNVISGEDKYAAYVFAGNVLKAFVISNANVNPRILITISIVIYLIFIALFIFSAARLKAMSIKNDRTKNSSQEYLQRALLFGFIVATGLAINCVVTGSMIFPQPRYMCYSMGLFYMSLCLLFVPER